MAPMKKTASPSKKKGKMASPMKKASSSSAKLSQAYKSPTKKQSNAENDSQRSGAPKRPNYQRMVTETLATLDSRKGATRAKLLQHIKQKYGVDSKVVNVRLRAAVKALLEESIITLAKGSGYSDGHFRMAPKGKAARRESKSDSENQAPKSRGRPRKNSATRSKSLDDKQTNAKAPKRARSASKAQAADGKSKATSQTRSRSSNQKSTESGKGEKSQKTKKARSSSQGKSMARRSSSRSPMKSKKKDLGEKQQNASKKRQPLKAMDDNDVSHSGKSKKKSADKTPKQSSSPAKKTRNSATGKGKKAKK